MIEVRHVTKFYGGKAAVSDASFRVETGAVLGFLGRNGAGKSTMMNMITGYTSVSEGDIFVDGYDVARHSMDARRRIGYLPEQPPLYMDMTVKEYLRFCCEIKSVRPAMISKHLADIMALMGLEHVSDRLIRNLSKGYKQRVGLGQALAGNPDVIILDEPTVGLDPTQMVDIRKLILSLGKTHTVILSSHILSEVQDVCDEVVIINEGHIVATDQMARFTRQTESRQWLLRTNERAESVLRAVQGVLHCALQGQKESGTEDYLLELDADDVQARRMLSAALAERHLPILQLSPCVASLEDAFLTLTGDREKG